MRSVSPREAWLDRLANEIRQRSTRECSQATPRKRHPANESSPEMSPQCSTVTKLMHEILSRCTVMKYVSEVRLRVIQQDDRKSITQQQQMQDRHMQPSQLNV